MSSSRDYKKHTTALNTFVKLVRCADKVTRDVHRHFLNELTVSQFGILEALYHLGPLSQKDLAAKILKSPGNITTIVNNLEKKDLVARVASENDRRFCTIVLTEAGRALIGRIFPSHADGILKRMSLLSTEEQRSLGKLLLKLSGGRR